MKYFFTLLAFSGGLFSCSKEQAATLGDVAATIGQPFALEINQKAILPTTGGSTVQVVVATINDSRCPSDMTCIVAGNADVDVSLADASAAPRQVRLGLSYRPSLATDSILVTLNQHDYWLRLLAVNPYHGRATASLPKTAVLRLRPR